MLKYFDLLILMRLLIDLHLQMLSGLHLLKHFGSHLLSLMLIDLQLLIFLLTLLYF